MADLAFDGYACVLEAELETQAIAEAAKERDGR